MDFSIVIPVKDEQENVEPLVAEMRRALDGRFDYELIFVDDGSTDGTWQRLVALRAGGYERLRLVRHRDSVGQSTAILSGVRRAKAPWIVTLDGDGQNDPADIPPMVTVAREAAAGDGRVRCVAGYRKNRRDTWVRRLSSRVANGIRSRLLKDATPDSGCGLKVIARETFLELPYFDHMHRFLPALIRRAGGRVLIHEVHHRHRQRGRSKYGIGNRLWVGIVDLLGVMWLQRRAKLPWYLYGQDAGKES